LLYVKQEHIGYDLFPAYETAGFSLFKDEEKMKGHFITANIFDLNPESE